MSFIKKILEFINKYFKSLIFLLILFLIFAPSKEGEFKKPNLMKIELKGPIFDDSEFLSRVKEAKNKNIKGVLLVVDSPGGAVAPSVEMSLAIKELKKQKPVVAYAKGMMTSGSYYASIWADKIIANPGSIIGSIGVIFQSPNIQELANKIGIKEQVVKAGKYKEVGTPIREWKPYEKKELEKIIKSTYDMFVMDVAKARNLDINNKNEFADAHIFTPPQAKEVGLIDEIANISYAKETLKKMAKVKKAVWKEKSKFDQFLDKLLTKISLNIYNHLTGLKAYF